MEQATLVARRMNYWLWLGPLLFMLTVGLYFVVRYQGRWADGDSAVFTNVIRVFVREGTLTPSNGQIYPNGYAYQAISTFIVTLTGLDVTTLQQLLYPVLAALVVLPAWLLYRELIGSGRGATLATMLLFTQPEFLFVILRSSHEKFTRALLLLCLFWLVRSFKMRHRPWQFATHVGLFYLTAFALIASNNLLAHSFIFAIVVALLLGWLLEKRKPAQHDGPSIKRLVYPVGICLGLVYLLTFFIYPPAQHDLIVLRTVWDRIAALFLGVQTQTQSAYHNPYAPVETGWISLPVYFVLSIANWIILVASFVIWARQGWRWLRRSEAPDTTVARLPWLLYAAFVAQGALSIIADTSGALGSNLQHRIFPSFATIAVALVAGRLIEWRPQRHARSVALGLSAAIFCISILSVLKATNEPALSNKWTFYRAYEIRALDWSDRHLPEAEIWSDLDERLGVAYMTESSEVESYGRFPGWELRPTTRNLIVTELSRLRSSRLRQPLPLPPDALRVYDNGKAQLYHLRPETPYQP